MINSRLFEISSELQKEPPNERKIELLKEVIPILEEMKPLENLMFSLTGVKISVELEKMKNKLKELEVNENI